MIITVLFTIGRWLLDVIHTVDKSVAISLIFSCLLYKILLYVVAWNMVFLLE